MSLALIILALVSAFLAVTMIFAKSPVTAALGLLGVLICTAGIYGLIGEHLVATIQLVVYAGAIMVLFVFSIMLLNLNILETDFRRKPKMLAGVLVLSGLVFGGLAYALNQHYAGNHAIHGAGPYTPEFIKSLGGNTVVLSHALFSQFYISFEVISLALIVAVVGAVVLAKRKVD
jgi:NADH-quinone oxidoreductase subunit J